MRCVPLLIAFVAVFAALVAVALSAESRTLWHQLHSYTFDQYAAEFKKTYDTPEETQFRKGLFEPRLEEIRRHNADPAQSYKRGVNHLTDRTDSEFRKLLGYRKDLARSPELRQSLSRYVRPYVRSGSVSSLPASVDWRLKGAVTPVKDQGQCGSCWAFASTSTMESAWFLKKGQLSDLSMQQVASCTQNPLDCGGSGGCEGGIAELGYQGVINATGISSMWTYPYLSYSGSDYVCQLGLPWFSFSAAAQFSSWVKLPENEYEPLLEALATVGPIAISVDASSWSSYETGIFTGCNNTNPDVDHVVQLVGYDTTQAGQQYWLVRNSWSTSWGEDGYVRLPRSSNPPCGLDLSPGDGSACKPYPPSVKVCGVCGMLSDSSYPVV